MPRNYEDRAVHFGESVEMGLEDDRAFPFVYPFIRSTDDTWEATKTVDNLAGMGVRIAPGATVQHTIRMDSDHPYMLKSVRLFVYFNGGAGVAGPYEWYDNEAGFYLDVSCPNDCIGTPLIRFIRVDMSIAPSNTTLLGGPAMQPFTAAGTFNGKRPVPLHTLQGTDYGRGEGRLECLIPRSGMVQFELTNTHAVKTVLVGGMLEGCKVRI